MSFFFKLLCSPLSLITSAHLAWVWGHPPEYGSPSRGLSLNTTDHYPQPISVNSNGWGLISFLTQLVWPCSDNHSCCVSWIQQHCCVQKTLFHPSYLDFAGLTIFMLPPFHDAPCTLRETVGYRHLICGWAHRGPYFLYFDQLWVSALNVIHYTKLL